MNDFRNIVAGGLLVLALSACAPSQLLERLPVVNINYTQQTQGLMPIEAKYTKMGQFAVSSQTLPSGESQFSEFKIWYPQDIAKMNKWPVVVFANGTGIPHYKYEAVFEHLASWGFVVIGNDDKNSWSGLSSSKSLALLDKLNNDKNSVFFNKLDTQNAGISGHSQGGVGAINGATNHANSQQFKAVFTASTTKLALANGLKWPYDISKVQVPYFSVAGTGVFDAGDGKPDSGIAPVASMSENYAKLQNGRLTVSARRKNIDHGEMLFKADGYMTAWFLYHLKKDLQAGQAFLGPQAEIQRNNLWQDVWLKNN